MLLVNSENCKGNMSGHGWGDKSFDTNNKCISVVNSFLSANVSSMLQMSEI